MRTWLLGTALIAVVGVVGCGGSAKPTKPVATKSGSPASASTTDAAAPDASAEPPRRKFQPVQLGGSDATASADNSTAGGGEARSMQDVVAAMQPLQVMLGKWRGTTNKKFNGFNAIDESEWIWDFRTDRAQPALTVTSDKSPYYRMGRLTYLPRDQAYQLTLTLPDDGGEKIFKGTWKEEPAEVPGDDNKPQRTYKLALDQVAPKDDDEPWQVVFSQQENNRYLLEINRHRPGVAVTRLDTIGSQRLGTSFALNDEDYGDKKCIISGGLGTIQVSYKGKSYWVCCTGCKAAFEEEPERWLAKLTKDGEMKK